MSVVMAFVPDLFACCSMVSSSKFCAALRPGFDYPRVALSICANVLLLSALLPCCPCLSEMHGGELGERELGALAFQRCTVLPLPFRDAWRRAGHVRTPWRCTGHKDGSAAGLIRGGQADGTPHDTTTRGNGQDMEVSCKGPANVFVFASVFTQWGNPRNL